MCTFRGPNEDTMYASYNPWGHNTSTMVYACTKDQSYGDKMCVHTLPNFQSTIILYVRACDTQIHTHTLTHAHRAPPHTRYMFFYTSSECFPSGLPPPSPCSPHPPPPPPPTHTHTNFSIRRMQSKCMSLWLQLDHASCMYPQ